MSGLDGKRRLSSELVLALKQALHIVYWDNQAVLHARTAFDPKHRRVMKRVSLAGSPPF